MHASRNIVADEYSTSKLGYLPGNIHPQNVALKNPILEYEPTIVEFAEAAFRNLRPESEKVVRFCWNCRGIQATSR